jgi:sulfite reductase alpha subunit-like flavoprotein
VNYVTPPPYLKPIVGLCTSWLAQNLVANVIIPFYVQPNRTFIQPDWSRPTIFIAAGTLYLGK